MVRTQPVAIPGSVGDVSSVAKLGDEVGRRSAAHENGVAPFGRQHRHQDAGRRRMENQKHGADDLRHWRKVYLGIDAATLEIRAIDVTDSAISDAPMLPCLLEQIPAEETVTSVSGNSVQFFLRVLRKELSHRRLY